MQMMADDLFYLHHSEQKKSAAVISAKETQCVPGASSTKTQSPSQHNTVLRS